MGVAHFWAQGDAIARAVALLLLAMSVTGWVVIFWKAWLLRRAGSDIDRAVPAFWAAPTVDAGREALARLDREGVLLPLLAAATAPRRRGWRSKAGATRSRS